MKLGTLTHFAIHPKAATMHVNEMFGDGQTETGASGFARTCDIHAVEALEDAGLVGFRNADSGV
jgi:hypothetical protein